LKNPEDEMLILHCATAEETNQMVYGYTLQEDGKVFIVWEDGVRVPVRPETVMPYQAYHRLEDHISLTKRTLTADETGSMMSDSARRAYRESVGDIDYAFDTSQKDHEQWVSVWGDEDTYIQAHGAFGTEVEREFGIDRSMVSVTTDRGVAEYYAAPNGRVIEMQVPASQLHPQTLAGAGEQEYLIFNGTR